MAQHNINENKNTWAIYYGYVKADRQAFIDELRHKGFKLTGREGISKIVSMILNPSDYKKVNKKQ